MRAILAQLVKSSQDFEIFGAQPWYCQKLWLELPCVLREAVFLSSVWYVGGTWESTVPGLFPYRLKFVWDP